MAKATIRTVEEPVTTVIIKNDGVTLELSSAEAQTLAEIFASIGGSPFTSARKHTNAIQEQLCEVGYDYTSSDRHEWKDGQITFYEASLVVVEAPK